MTDTPSDAAIEEALRRSGMTEKSLITIRAHPGNSWCAAILSHARSLMEAQAYRQEVSDAVRKAFAGNAVAIGREHWFEVFSRFMLPDPVDPLEEILGRVTAEQLRAELDKRGLTIAPKGE